MKYFIANWKANKNLAEADAWINLFLKLINKNTKINKLLKTDQIKIVICPPFPFINLIKKGIVRKKNVHVGAQDLSFFPSGSYTGEVTARSLSGLVDYVILGHSERRKYFKEDEMKLADKVRLALDYQIKPIFCIRDTKDAIPDQINITAYEPVWAIGTGKNEPLTDVLKVKKNLHLKPKKVFIYGGSVNAKNCSQYLVSEQINGFLIGSASLDPLVFFEIINQTR